jgi:uncharacterized protein YkwD
MSATTRRPRSAARRSEAPATRVGHVARRAVLVSLVFAAASAPAAFAACAGSDLAPAGAVPPDYVATTLCLINAQRAEHGLGVVSHDGILDGASMAYAQRMVAESYFGHVAPDGADLADRLYTARYMSPDDKWIVGENLAWGTGPLSSPSAILAAWMASPDHRANILTAEYRAIGIGAVPGIPSDHTTGVTITTDFGTVVHAPPAQPTPAPRIAKRAAARTAASSKRRACLRGATIRQRLAGQCSAKALLRRERSLSAAKRRDAARHAAGRAAVAPRPRRTFAAGASVRVGPAIPATTLPPRTVVTRLERERSRSA